jgi:hypothetical protein
MKKTGNLDEQLNLLRTRESESSFQPEKSSDYQATFGVT